MSNHLPECFWGDVDEAGNIIICICQELRACEQRVRESWYEVQSETWEQGFKYALDAAREAVSALPKEDGGYCHVLHACDVEAVLDDLRGRQK